MLAVLGLVPADGLRTVDDLVGDLLAARGGQAVHELGVRGGHRHELFGHLVRRVEDGHALVLRQLLVVQAVPHVGVHEVGVLHGLLAVVGDGDAAAGLLAVLAADLKQVLADLVPLGAVLHEVHAHLRADEHLGHAHLGGVAHEHHLAVLDALALGQVLDHGEEVAHLLCGVVVVGHAVDHRHLRVLRQLDEVLVTVDTRHDDVEEAPHHARGVLDGLVAAQLDGAGRVELRIAAEVGHGALERQARAG